MSALTEFRAHCLKMAAAEHKPECCRCGVTWCCGCIGHPHGKPWGWAAAQWDEHLEKCPGDPSAPPCEGCNPEADRALFARMAAEVDDYLAPQVDLFGEVTAEPQHDPTPAPVAVEQAEMEAG